MELSFFNLRYNPFVTPPAPPRLFRSHSYLRGMQEMAYGIEGRKGMIAVLAPRGIGKTTLVHAYLTQRLQRDLRTIEISGRSTPFTTILDRLCAQCGVAADGEFEVTLRALRAALRREAETGRRVVLLIDEADSLSSITLEDLLVLADLEDGSGKLLSVILIGEPVLDQHLKRACTQTLLLVPTHHHGLGTATGWCIFAYSTLSWPSSRRICAWRAANGSTAPPTAANNTPDHGRATPGRFAHRYR